MRCYTDRELDFIHNITEFRYVCTLMGCQTMNCPCVFKTESLHTVEMARARGCPEPCQVVANHLRDI